MILSLDTTQPRASVGLYAPDGSILFEAEYDAMNQHGESLLPALSALFVQHGIVLDSLTGVAVCVGPGSFNGVRVGLSTAAALRLALGVPVFGASSFARERVVAPVGSACLVCLEAGRGEVYAELTSADGENVHGALVCVQSAVEELAAGISDLLRLPREQTNDEGSAPAQPRARMLFAATRGLSPMLEIDAVYVRPPDITSSRASQLPVTPHQSTRPA